MNDLADALREAGLRPRRLDMTPEQWHRCPTVDKPKSSNGRYILGYTKSGEIFATILDMARPGWSMVWKPDAPTVIQPMDPAKLKAARATDRRRQREATEAAREFYSVSPPLRGGHPYLTGKGLDMQGCMGLRRDADGWLVVPMARRGRLVSVQRIAPDGQKRFWTGAPIAGVWYTLDRRGASLTVLCEGLATGLALYSALPLARIVVCFTASNLPKVAAQLPRNPQKGMFVVAADNDHETAARIGSNPGLDAGHAAAALLGSGVAAPACKGSDWCDYRQERLAALTGQIYGKRSISQGQALRTVEGEIRSQVMRHAKKA